MKEVVYAVYHDVNREERSKELMHCCCKLGNVHMITYATPETNEKLDLHLINKDSPLALLSFLHTAKSVIKKVKPDIVVLHDNDCSALIPYIKRVCKSAFIIYDSSELYLKESAPLIIDIKRKRIFGDDGFVVWAKQKLTTFRMNCEKKYLKEVDLVFAANVERAQIMKDYFQLKKTPEIFDNVHRIDDPYNVTKCKEKFDSYFKKNHFSILFAGGISTERKTFDYIKAFQNVDDDFDLIIVGSASPRAINDYTDLIQKCGLKTRVHYLGYVSRAELRYLMKKSDASVVIFDTNSYNTLYCESGKCYESLFEFTPILASENPPLKRLCEEKHVGVSNDNYSYAMKELRSNYEYYKSGVEHFIVDLNYENRLNRITQIIKEAVGDNE